MLSITTEIVEFFAINTKLPMMAMLASIGFEPAKNIIFNGALPDDHWNKSPMLNQLS